MSLIFVLSFLLLTGLGLLLAGLRGRRVDDHPLCRRCGFDLTGKPETSNLCSECGADVSLPHAIRIGHREKRGRLVFTGVMLTMLGLTAGGLMIWAATNAGTWQAAKPVWWLMRESRSSDGQTHTAALAELSRRMSAAQLSDVQITKLCERVLEIQAARNIPWNAAWGDIVESARDSKKLSDAQWEAYAEQAPGFQLDLRRRVRLGDPIYYWIRENSARVGSRDRIWAARGGVVWDIGPVRINRDHGMSNNAALRARGSGATGTTIEPRESLARLTPGDYTVKYTTRVELRDGSERGPVIKSGSIELIAPLTIVPPDQSTVTLIKDDSLRAAIEKSLQRPTLNTGSLTYRHLGGGISVNNPPVGLGFEMFAKINGQEVAVGRFAVSRGKVHGFGFGSGKLDAELPEQVDVILRPSTQAAINTSDTFEIWDGEIVLRDVKVLKPATMPSSKPSRR